jgi:hypothetical protein
MPKAALVAALAPDLCITLHGLSKKVAPGCIVAPPRLRERVKAAVRSGFARPRVGTADGSPVRSRACHRTSEHCPASEADHGDDCSG